jgi:hypothetical protein
MSNYIVFFGKSQDFTTSFYDHSNPLEDFNSIIKDFDLLESKIFTVDDINNKEILSRYFFTSQNKKFCLLKLYSFAQASNGNRVAGSIYGVGLISDKNIAISNDNLELLRVAKDNFAKLSLDGYKFKKSNIQDDTYKIWRAIVDNKDGNLLEKIDTSNLVYNGSDDTISFLVKDLFKDSEDLYNRVSVSKQDIVYFSEDLEHLKRTQKKWGKDKFPIYWKQNEKYVPYVEPITQPQSQTNIQDKSRRVSDDDNNDIVKLRTELSDVKYNNLHLQKDLEKNIKKLKTLTYIIYGLLVFIFIMLLFTMFFKRTKKVAVTQETIIHDTLFIEKPNQLSIFLTDDTSLNNGINFFKAVQFIYVFNPEVQYREISKLQNEFKVAESIAINKNIDIDNIRSIFNDKIEKVGLLKPKNINSSKNNR